VTAQPGVALERMFAVAVPEGMGAIVGGFDGAATASAAISIADRTGHEIGRATADANGRFEASLPGVMAGEIVGVGIGGLMTAFTVRDPAAAREEAVCASIDGAGSVPNDLIIVGSGEGAHGVLVRSGDNAVSSYDLEVGLSGGGGGVRLPAKTEGTCGQQHANPWFAATLDPDGHRVAVTAEGQRDVYIVDMDRGAIERTLTVSARVMIDPPVQLASALDVDCDGVLKSSVASFIPRGPQPIAVVGRRLIVGYTNVVSHVPPEFLPGVIAVWSLDALDRDPRLILLDAADPQEVRALDDHRVLIVCSGAIDVSGPRSVSPGAIFVLDADQGAIIDRFDLGDFAPGTAVIMSGALWTGSIVKGVVRRVDLGHRATPMDISVSGESVDSIFRMIDLDGGLLAVPSFDSDRLHILDTRSALLDPAPFYAPLATGPGRPILDGLQIVARRSGSRGVDFLGPDLYVLGGLASRVTPLNLRRILGP
jgi:hypothetical protein